MRGKFRRVGRERSVNWLAMNSSNVEFRIENGWEFLFTRNLIYFWAKSCLALFVGWSIRITPPLYPLIEYAYSYSSSFHRPTEWRILISCIAFKPFISYSSIVFSCADSKCKNFVRKTEKNALQKVASSSKLQLLKQCCSSSVLKLFRESFFSTALLQQCVCNAR